MPTTLEPKEVIAILGVLARVESDRKTEILEALDSIPGVSTFSVEEEGRVGALIEGDSLQAVHDILVGQVENVPGLLCAWPVYSHLEEEPTTTHHM